MTARVPVLLLTLMTLLAGLLAPTAWAQGSGFAGRWDGVVDQPSGPLTVTLRLVEGEGDGFSGTATIPLRAVHESPLADLTVAGRSISFGVPRAGATFECRLSDDGSEIVGFMTQAGQRYTVRLLRGVDRPDAEISLFPPLPRERQRWRGMAEFPNLNLDLVFTFIPEGEDGWTGTLDIPLQGVRGLELANIELGDEFHFTVVDPGTVDRPEPIFFLKRTAPGIAAGEMRQAGSSIGVRMERLENPDEEVGVSRPQTPEPPFPYATREVELTSPVDGVTLAGELVIPAGEGPFPGVVFITGSGAQDRDQTIAGHKPFLVLADRLARMGVASLRLDDRGVGGSGGDPMALTAVVAIQDIHAAVEFLRSQPVVKGDEVGLLGHSEGAMLAPMASRMSPRPASFLVLLAPPAIRGDELLLLQREALRRAQGVSADRLARERELHERLVALAKQGAGGEAVSQALYDLAAAERVGRDDQAEYAARVTEAQGAVLTTPWFIDFLRRDPQPSLRKTTAPTLAVFGERDLQVPPAPNADEMRLALDTAGNTHADVRVMQGLNHLLQPCVTGLPDEYFRILTTISEDVIIAIEDFLGGVTSAEAPARPTPEP